MLPENAIPTKTALITGQDDSCLGELLLEKGSVEYAIKRRTQSFKCNIQWESATSLALLKTTGREQPGQDWLAGDDPP